MSWEIPPCNKCENKTEWLLLYYSPVAMSIQCKKCNQRNTIIPVAFPISLSWSENKKEVTIPKEAIEIEKIKDDVSKIKEKLNL